MVTADDVAAVVFAQLTAVSGFATTCPGGAFLEREPDTPLGYPYVVYQVEEGRTEWFSGDGYKQLWTVRLAAYCPIGASGVSPQLVEQAMYAALVTEAANTALRGVNLRNSTEHVLHGRPMGGQAKYAQELRQGRDVFVAGLTVELLVQGDRSVT